MVQPHQSTGIQCAFLTKDGIPWSSAILPSQRLNTLELNIFFYPNFSSVDTNWEENNTFPHLHISVKSIIHSSLLDAPVVSNG